MRIIGRRAATALVALMAGVPAQAHHSAAMFDRSNPVTITGTVKEFGWSNPHAWVRIMVPDGSGGSDEYTLEGPGVAGMIRNGLTRRDIQPGDTIKFLVAPRRDGSHAGEFMALWKNGRNIRFM